jgi:hypothetical protein
MKPPSVIRRQRVDIRDNSDNRLGWIAWSRCGRGTTTIGKRQHQAIAHRRTEAIIAI